jgi:hypothetical protein
MRKRAAFPFPQKWVDLAIVMFLRGKDTFEQQIICNHGYICHVAQESNGTTALSLIVFRLCKVALFTIHCRQTKECDESIRLCVQSTSKINDLITVINSEETAADYFRHGETSSSKAD